MLLPYAARVLTTATRALELAVAMNAEEKRDLGGADVGSFFHEMSRTFIGISSVGVLLSPLIVALSHALGSRGIAAAAGTSDGSGASAEEGGKGGNNKETAVVPTGSPMLDEPACLVPLLEPLAQLLKTLAPMCADVIKGRGSVERTDTVESAHPLAPKAPEKEGGGAEKKKAAATAENGDAEGGDDEDASMAAKANATKEGKAAAGLTQETVAAFPVALEGAVDLAIQLDARCALSPGARLVISDTALDGGGKVLRELSGRAFFCPGAPTGHGSRTLPHRREARLRTDDQ